MVTGVFESIVEHHDLFMDLCDIVDILLDDLQTFVNEGFLEWINEKLSEISVFVKEHKDDIVELLERIAKFAWDSFKTFVDTVINIVEFLVEHKDILDLVLEGITLVSEFISNHLTEVLTVLLGLKIGSWLLDIVTKISIASIAFGGFSGVIGVLQTAFSALMGPIGIVIAALGVFIGLFGYFYDTSEDFRDIISNLATTIKETFGSAITRVSDAWSELTSAFSDSAFSDTLMYIIIGISDILTGVLALAINVVADALTSVINVIKDCIQFINGLIEIVEGIIKLFTGDFEGAIELFKSGLLDICTSIISFFGHVWEVVSDLIVDILDMVADIFTGFYSGIRDGWEKIKDRVKGVFAGIIDFIKGIFGIHSPSTVFSDIGKNITEGLKNGIVGAWNSLTSTVSSKLSELRGMFSDTVSNIWSGIQSVGSDISVKIQGAFSNNTSNLRQKCYKNFVRKLFVFLNRIELMHIGPHLDYRISIS